MALNPGLVPQNELSYVDPSTLDFPTKPSSHRLAMIPVSLGLQVSIVLCQPCATHPDGEARLLCRRLLYDHVSLDVKDLTDGGGDLQEYFLHPAVCYRIQFVVLFRFLQEFGEEFHTSNCDGDCERLEEELRPLEPRDPISNSPF